MTIARPNPKSRLPAALAPLLPDRAAQYVIMDIGARGGLLPQLRPLAPIASTIGFEPDTAECERLNRESDGHLTVHPVALAGRSGMHPFYVVQFPYSSGLRRVNEAWIERFPVTTLKVVKELQVEAVTLDEFCRQSATSRVDFIKIDVEGSEHEILDAGRQMLREQRVLGLFTEVWWDPVLKGQPGFAEIDILMREQGFRFFDLSLHRYARATLPAGRLSVKGLLKRKPKMDLAYGQSWTCDALYFRDPVGELKAGALDPMWDRDTLLRLCGLYDVFDYGDCAIEVLETFRGTLLADVDVDRLIDAALPQLGGFALAYNTYRDLSIYVRQAFNKRTHKLTDWVPPATGYRKR